MKFLVASFVLGAGVCFAIKDKSVGGWDCMMILGEPPLPLGETWCGVGFVFPSGQRAADIMRAARTFYLWEFGFYGEATLAQPKL
jgi:hypothetical protein